MDKNQIDTDRKLGMKKLLEINMAICLDETRKSYRRCFGKVTLKDHIYMLNHAICVIRKVRREAVYE